MELIEYLRMLARRWTWVVGAATVGVLLASAYISTAQKTYTASADLFVGVGSADASLSAAAAQSYSNFTLGRMPSYATLVKSTEVSDGLASQVGVSDSDRALRKNLSATVVPRSVVLTLSAKYTDADKAAAIANAAAERLAKAIDEIERPAPNRPSTVTTSIIRPAPVPVGASAPKPPLILALGLLAGLGLGLLAASARDQAVATRTPRRRNNADDGRGQEYNPSDPLSDLSGELDSRIAGGNGSNVKTQDAIR